MKVIALADVHQSEQHWERLVEAVCDQKPDLVLIAGDLLPKYDGILPQVNYIARIKDYSRAIKDNGAELVLVLGNDDNQLAIPEMEQSDREGLWHYVQDRCRQVAGYTLCGCPWINDYPFAYKYWVAAESREDLSVSPFQLGPPAIINEKNEIAEIPNLEAYLKNKPSIREALQNMAERVEDFSRSIWLIHCPPTGLDLDLCGSGDRVGSPQIYEFIREKQPLITIHGHIHEAPACNGGIWARKVGQTMVIQPGQSFEELNYVTFDLSNGEINEMEHSVYGVYEG